MNQVNRIAEELNKIHWDGTGCGTNGVNACVYCFGPSPMSSYEIAQFVLNILAVVE